MSIRCLESGNRRARHQEIFKNPFVDDGDFLRKYAVIVELVIAIEVDAAHSFGCRVIDYGNEIGQYRLIDLLRERLSFALALLAMTFYTMAENLVEKYAARAAG